MRSVKFKSLRMLAVVGAVSTLLSAGCDSGVMSGVWAPKEAAKSQAEFRTESEIVSNAVLMREPTLPEWQLGRHAFQRGTSRLIVLSRITAWPDPPKDKDDKPPVIDRTIERLWLEIPSDVPLGQEVKLEELEKRFLIGYDMCDIATGKYYIRPFKALGSLTMLEEKPEGIVTSLNIGITLDETTPWKMIETKVVSVSANGVRATLATSPDAKPVRRVSGTPTYIAPSTTAPPTPGSVTATTPSNPAPTANTTTPVNATANSQPLEAGKPAEKSFIGKWVADPGSFKINMQFDLSNRFICMITRGADNNQVALRAGTYQVKADYLVLHVDRFEIDGEDKMREMSSPYLMLRTEWSADGPIIEGDIKSKEGRLRIPLKPGTFGDMKLPLPPAPKPN